MASATHEQLQSARCRRDELSSPFRGGRLAVDAPRVLSTPLIPVEVDKGDATLFYMRQLDRRVKFSFNFYSRLPNTKLLEWWVLSPGACRPNCRLRHAENEIKALHNRRIHSKSTGRKLEITSLPRNRSIDSPGIPPLFLRLRCSSYNRSCLTYYNPSSFGPVNTQRTNSIKAPKHKCLFYCLKTRPS